MSTTAQLTETEVREFVLDWYKKLDVHVPVEDLLPNLAGDELEMRLPETTLHGQGDFIKWYDGVTHKFFDEAHTMKDLNITVSQEQADVQLVVNWQAHIWNAPSPNSQWIGFDAAQRWTVKLSPGTNKLIVTTYIVDAFTPMPGSPDL